MRENRNRQGTVKTQRASIIPQSNCVPMTAHAEGDESLLKSFREDGFGADRRLSMPGCDLRRSEAVTSEEYARRKSCDGWSEFRVDDNAGHSGPAFRHTRPLSADSFEHCLDKCVHKLIIFEDKKGQGKEGMETKKTDACVNQSSVGPDHCRKDESFEERALRFGIEDWTIVDKKWVHGGAKASKQLPRVGVFHSPSGSDSSSLISTQDSSSFSCGSDSSSFLIPKSEVSPLSSIIVKEQSVPTLMLPATQAFAGKCDNSERYVEVVDKKTLDSRKTDHRDAKAECDIEDGNFLEFNFLDGKMVESQIGGVEDCTGVRRWSVDLVSCSSSKDEEFSSEEFAAVRGGSMRATFHSATMRSPGSESFFGSSQDSDWSGTQSLPCIIRQSRRLDGGAASEFDDDEVSRGSVREQDRVEEWADSSFFDIDSSAVEPKTPPNSASKDSANSCSSVAGKASKILNRYESERLSAALKAHGKSLSEGLVTRRTETPRRVRSLGSVLSHHVVSPAQTVSLSTQGSSKSLLEKKTSKNAHAEIESPAKATAACIDWLWSERGVFKQPVQALRALSERDGANPATSTSRSSTARNLDSAFRDSKTKGRNGSSKNPLADIRKKSTKVVESTPRGLKDPVKESRSSILTSWASVYGSGPTTGDIARLSNKNRNGSPSAVGSKKGAKSGVSMKKSPSGAKDVAQASVPKLGPKTSIPVSKYQLEDMEVLCRPFGPVLKSARCLPAPGPRRPPGKSSLFHSRGDASHSCSSVSSANAPSSLKSGKIQCVLSREGFPSYSLMMDDSEEIFVAKSLRVDTPGSHDGVTHAYSFHSYREKSKGKGVWRNWGKKEKPTSDFAGKMKVSTTICPVVSCGGVQNYVDSEFVLFDAKSKEISISGPTSASPGPRSSFSSWDTTPLRSPRVAHSNFSSPSSAYFSLPSPATGTYSSPAAAPSLAVPSRYVYPGIPTVNGARIHFNAGAKSRQLERHMSLDSPLQHYSKLSSCAFQEVWSDSEGIEDGDRLWSPQSMLELAAVVVRSPMEKQQDRIVHPVQDTVPTEAWGWGINFLKRSSDRSRTSSVHDDEGRLSSPRMSEDGAESCAGSNKSCGSCGSSCPDQTKWGLSVTLILPAGDHGCSSNGMEGPQPLIERWRSGGKCDCGSWDLGCGLTIVDNQRLDLSLGRGAQQQEVSLKLFVQGKHQGTVGLSMMQLREGLYTLGFQAPVSTLHAFATAVAILHSRDPVFPTRRVAEQRRRLPRMPVKVIPSSIRSFSRPIDETYGLKPIGNYQLVCCPDPPLSPFGRA